MKVQILDSRPLSEDICLERRKLFKSAGLVVVGSILPAFVVREANAQSWLGPASTLISAAVSAVELYKSLWGVKEPTNGTVTFINRNNDRREGDFWLAVLAAMYEGSQYPSTRPQYPEDVRLLPFSVPAGHQVTYGFRDGPFGLAPGDKYLEGRTRMGTYRTNMTVEL